MPPEPLKVNCFLKMFKDDEKWAKSASSKTGLFVHFFSKCYHSKTNKDNDMTPKLVEAWNMMRCFLPAGSLKFRRLLLGCG